MALPYHPWMEFYAPPPYAPWALYFLPPPPPMPWGYEAYPPPPFEADEELWGVPPVTFVEHCIPEGAGPPPPDPAAVPSGNLYVAPLPPTFTPPKVRALFARFGRIFSVVHFKSRRAACVQFVSPEDAARAIEELDGLELSPEAPITVKYADRAYTPHRLPPAAEEQHSGSECESVGHLARTASDVASVGSLDWEPAAEAEQPEGKEWNAARCSPPSVDAIEEANLLLEAAMIGTALNARLQEALQRGE